MANKNGNPQNLVSFKKGYDKKRDGNGRKPKLPNLDQLLDEVLGEEKNDITAMKAVLISLLGKALKGDVRASEILLERAYGKSKQPMDITTAGDKILITPTIVLHKDNE